MFLAHQIKLKIYLEPFLTHKLTEQYIEGSLRTQKWTGKQNVDRYTTEIIANNLQLLDHRPQQSDGQNNAASQPSSPQQNNSGFDDMDDDIPF